MSDNPSDPAATPREPVQPYGSMPPPSEHETSAVVPEPPQPVRRAATILYVIVAWSLLSLVLGFATTDATKDAIRDSDPTLTESQVEAAATLGLVVGAVFAIAFGLLYVLCARKMLQGRNWGRIVPTVLIGLGLLFGVIGLAAGGSTGTTSIGLFISAALGIAFLVFAWSRQSNDFFKAARIPR